MLDAFASTEKSHGVLQGLAWPLDRLAGPHGDRVAMMLQRIFNRVTEGPGAEEVREMCVNILTGLYVWQNQSVAREIITTIGKNPSKNTQEIHHVLFRLRSTLTHGKVGSSAEEEI